AGADRVLLAAGDRALEAGGVAVVIVRLHLLAADGAGRGEDLAAQVVAAERAERVDRPHQERRAERRQGLRALLERLPRLVEQGLERGRVRQLRLARALHHERLDVLAAEHRAEAAATGDALPVLPVVGHRREPHTPLAGGPDGDRVGVGALGPAEGADGVAGVTAPQRAVGREPGAALVVDDVG